MRASSITLAGVLLSACWVTKHVAIVSANEADATFVLQYEHGFEDYRLKWEDAEHEALDRCSAWGYSGVEFSDSGTIECTERHERKVTGFRPPGQSEEPGMGTQAAELERSRRSLGTVGKSLRTVPKTTDFGCIRWRVTYIGHCTN